MPTFTELSGNMHMHTPYSDGEKWHAEIAADAIRAGLDFIIVTDHNLWVDGVEGYYETDEGRVLLLSGEEVHNPRRQPQASHFLVYGAEAELSAYAADPQRLIDETNERGGYGFLAHPFDRGITAMGLPALNWRDWDIEGYTGIEIWNYMTSFAAQVDEQIKRLPVKHPLLNKLMALRVALNPAKFVTGPEPEVLTFWDEQLAAGNPLVAVGNSDAHGTPMALGPIKRVIYPYEFLFTAVNTHLLLDKPLSGDLADDKQRIIGAIGKGHSWIGYDLPHSTRGFGFSAQGRTNGIMGHRLPVRDGMTLQVKAPTPCSIRLIRHGEVVATAVNNTHLTYIASEPGAYRVECLLPYEGALRHWIFSNPIFLV